MDFHDLTVFKIMGTYLVKCSSVGFMECFFKMKIRLCIWGQEFHRSVNAFFPVQFIRKYKMSSVISGDVTLITWL
jgi:hypothetical protein